MRLPFELEEFRSKEDQVQGLELILSAGCVPHCRSVLGDRAETVWIPCEERVQVLGQPEGNELCAPELALVGTIWGEETIILLLCISSPSEDTCSGQCGQEQVSSA